jgi:hypothetical protein
MSMMREVAQQGNEIKGGHYDKRGVKCDKRNVNNVTREEGDSGWSMKVT